MKNLTTQGSQQNNDSDKAPPKLSALDKFFIAVTASGCLGGTALILLSYYIHSLVPIVPAIFFGSGISSLVYRFMGGIRQDTTITVGVAKLGGTLASLVATIWIFNEIIAHQISYQKIPELSFKPEEHKLLALDKDSGKLVKVQIGVNNVQKQVSTIISTPSESMLEQIKDFCRTNRGFCEEPDLRAIFQKDTSLVRRKAKVCSNQGKFVGYPLLIQNEAKKAFSRVNVIATDNCKVPINQPMLVKISPRAAEDILGGAETGNGFASIAPLKFAPEDN